MGLSAIPRPPGASSQVVVGCLRGAASWYAGMLSGDVSRGWCRGITTTALRAFFVGFGRSPHVNVGLSAIPRPPGASSQVVVGCLRGAASWYAGMLSGDVSRGWCRGITTTALRAFFVGFGRSPHVNVGLSMISRPPGASSRVVVCEGFVSLRRGMRGCFRVMYFGVPGCFLGDVSRGVFRVWLMGVCCECMIGEHPEGAGLW